MHGSLSIPFCYRANIYALCELQTLLVQSMACTLSLQQLGSDTILALQKVRLLLRAMHVKSATPGPAQPKSEKRKK